MEEDGDRLSEGSIGLVVQKRRPPDSASSVEVYGDPNRGCEIQRSTCADRGREPEVRDHRRDLEAG